MEALTFVGASNFPASVPVRIVLCVESTVLHHFDPSLAAGLVMKPFMRQPKLPLKEKIARMAINTCLGPDIDVPKTKEAYIWRQDSGR